MRPVAALFVLVFSGIVGVRPATAEQKANEPKQRVSRHFCGDFRTNDAEHTAISTVLKSNTALFSCQRLRHCCFDNEIKWLRGAAKAVTLFPHRPGWPDAMCAAVVVLDEHPHLKDAISDSLFGPVAFYEMTLTDVRRATTLKNLQHLSRLPKYDNLTVRILTEHPDQQLSDAVKGLTVDCVLTECDLPRLATNSRQAAGAVAASPERPAEEATLVGRGRTDKPLSDADMRGK